MFSAICNALRTWAGLSSRSAFVCLLAISMTGCDPKRIKDPPPPTEVRIVRPSSAYLQPSSIGPLRPLVLGDYIDYGYRCEAALAKCDADKAAITREVADGSAQDTR